MRSRARGAFVGLLLVAACGMPPPSPTDMRGMQWTPPEASLAEGQLQVYVPSKLASDGRRIRVRGMVRNPYAFRIDGVRLVFRLLGREARDADELERMERTLATPVEAGGQVTVNWDVESGYAGTAGWSFELQAFGVRAERHAGAGVAPTTGAAHHGGRIIRAARTPG